jgi:8-oxo-dGTP pyrophosphatase MutT (NUDIX family)
MGLQPDVTVAAVVEERGRFLVVEERINNRLVFNQPAGHVEKGETLLEAVAREAREETAWQFTPQALLGVYLWRNPRTGRSTMRFAFAGIVSDHNASLPLDRGIVRATWLSRAEMLENERRLRSPLVLRCVDDYLNGQLTPLDGVARLNIQSALQVPAVTI